MRSDQLQRSQLDLVFQQIEGDTRRVAYQLVEQVLVLVSDLNNRGLALLYVIGEVDDTQKVKDGECSLREMGFQGVQFLASGLSGRTGDRFKHFM